MKTNTQKSKPRMERYLAAAPNPYYNRARRKDYEINTTQKARAEELLRKTNLSRIFGGDYQ